MHNDRKQDRQGEDLYRRYLTGDSGAFEELVGQYENELFLFLNSIVHDYYEAKQLMIETFAQLAVGGGRFAEKSSLKTYLFTIGRNLAVRYLKMRRGEKHLPYESIIATLIDGGEEAYSFIERKENNALLYNAMMDLKVEYRNVLYLLYFEDMSYAEAGLVMKKSVKQISDLAYRAKASLKKKLEGEDLPHV